MIVNAAVTAYGMPKRKIARVSSFLAFSLFVGIVVCEVAGDTTDGIVDSREFDAVRETSTIFWSTVGRFRKVWQCFPRAKNTTVGIRLGGLEYWDLP